MKDNRFMWYDWILLAAFALFLLLCGCKPVQTKPRARSVKVLCFTAAWCGPCKYQKCDVPDVLKGYNWRFVDVDQEPAVQKHYEVRAVPTYVILVNGVEKSRVHSVKDLRKVIGR